MKSILVIDDEPEVLKPIQDYYSRKNVHSLSAESGRRGISLALEHLPDVIVCDVNLPDIDGFSVFQELQEHLHMRAIPFILISGSEDESYVQRGLQLGVNDYLTKPFTMDDLERSIAVHLDRDDLPQDKFDTAQGLLRQNISYALPIEVRTSLMGIMGYAQMMLDDHHKLSSDELSMFLDAIINSGRRLHHVIENYMVYSQLELIATDPQQRAGLRNNLVRAAPFIEASAQEVALQYNRLGDLDMRLDNAALRMSKENLSKIVLELVDNAFKFSMPGTPVKLRFIQDTTRIILQVRDYGRGMYQEELDQIAAFMAFQRAVRENRRGGLGLAIIRRLVELHQGEFEIISHFGQGTLVRIEFNDW